MALGCAEDPASNGTPWGKPPSTNGLAPDDGPGNPGDGSGNSGDGSGNSGSGNAPGTDTGGVPGAGAASGQGGSPGGAGMPGGAGAPNPMPPVGSCEVSSQPLRRLSHAEYDATVRDLFAGAALPQQFDLAPDQSIGGFTNNYSAMNPSPILIEQYWTAALSIVRAVAPKLDEFIPCDAGAGVACGEEFIRQFGRRAFRRTLTDEEVTELRAAFEEGPGSTDFKVGVQLAMLAMLQSPNFVYRPEFGVQEGNTERLTSFEAASRLSYLVWGSMPDDELLDRAEALQLGTSDDIAQEVSRMFDSAKAKTGMLRFHREWLKVSKLDTVLKRAEDGFDDATRNAIKESFDRFVWDTLFVNNGSATDLLTSTTFPANTRVAELLGASPVAAGKWENVDVTSTKRAGILGHPSFLAAHAYAGYPSPVLRGVFVMGSILCAPPSPPPADVDVTPPASGEEDPAGEVVTNRDHYNEATKEDRCQGCHSIINGIGFGFENFDTMGRYRDTDNGQPVDASGSVLGITYQNEVELASGIAGTDMFRACVVDKWMNYALGGSPLAQDKCFRDDVTKVFAEHDYKVKDLVIAIATHPKFWESFKGAQ
jgi:hypothetical protein